MAHHHFLLHAPHLCPRCVARIAPLAYAVRREVAAGRARVAYGHGEVALLVAVERHRRPRCRVVGHVVFAVFGGAVGLRVGIYAEHREVARLPGPHPVVGLSAELAHRLWHGEHQAHVAEVAVCGGVVLVALVERLYLEAQRRVFLLHLLRPCVLERVDKVGLPRRLHVVDAHLAEPVGDVFLLDHEAHEEVFVGQLVGIRLGEESVFHVVVLHCGVGVDGPEATVVVGEHKPVGRYDHAGAETPEVEHHVLDSVGARVEAVVGHGEAVTLHLVVDSLWQVVERPHAFVGMDGRGRKHRSDKQC